MKPPRGHLLKGVHAPIKSGGLQFQGFATLDQLERIGFLQPSLLAKSKLKDIEQNDPRAAKNKMLRDGVQRPFDTERHRNAVKFRGFLTQTEVMCEMGNVPAITLLIPEVYAHEDGIVVPYSSPVIAVDGETQSEARFMLRDQYPETGSDLIKITVYANVSPPDEYGQIILVNYNDNGTKVKKKIVKSVDPRGYVNRVINAVCNKARLDRDVAVNRFGNGGRGSRVVGLDQLQAAAVGATIGTTTPWDKDYFAINYNGADIEQCVEILTQMVEAVAGGNKELQKADPLIWQIVASLLRNGRTITDLHLSRATQAVEDRRRIGVNKRLSKTQKITILLSNI